MRHLISCGFCRSSSCRAETPANDAARRPQVGLAGRGQPAGRVGRVVRRAVLAGPRASSGARRGRRPRTPSTVLGRAGLAGPQGRGSDSRRATGLSTSARNGTGSIVGRPSPTRGARAAPASSGRGDRRGTQGPVVAKGQVSCFTALRTGSRRIARRTDRASQWTYGIRPRIGTISVRRRPRAVPVVAMASSTVRAEGQLARESRSRRASRSGAKTRCPVWRGKGVFRRRGVALVENGTLMANIGGRARGLWRGSKDRKVAGPRPTMTRFIRRRGGHDRGPPLRRVPDAQRTRRTSISGDRARASSSRRWRARQAASVNAATPLVVGDLIYVQPKYGPGPGSFGFDGTNLVEVWVSDEEFCRTTMQPVSCTNGHVYGFHGPRSSARACGRFELQTAKSAGARRFEEREA